MNHYPSDDDIARCHRCSDVLTTALDIESSICTACYMLIMMKPVDEMSS